MSAVGLQRVGDKIYRRYPARPPLSKTIKAGPLGCGGSGGADRCRNGPSHFISIPLNLDHRLDSAYERFRNQALGVLSDSVASSLMPMEKLHLTVAVLSIWDDEARLEAAESAMAQALCQQAAGRPLEVELEGLEVMRGTADACKVLYVGVRSNPMLDGLGAVLIRELEKHNLLCSSNDPIKWHCTLINTKYSQKHQPIDCFDATGLLRSLRGFRLGPKVVLKQVHLSSLHDPPDQQTSYYRPTAIFDL